MQDAHNQKEEFGYTGIWVPAEFMEDLGLSFIQAGLLAQIINLSKKKGYCYSSNANFAEKMGVEERTIQRMLQSLEDKHLICKEMQQDGYRHIIPLVGILIKKSTTHDKMSPPPTTKCHPKRKEEKEKNAFISDSCIQQKHSIHTSNGAARESTCNADALYEKMKSELQGTSEVLIRKWIADCPKEQIEHNLAKSRGKDSPGKYFRKLMEDNVGVNAITDDENVRKNLETIAGWPKRMGNFKVQGDQATFCSNGRECPANLRMCPNEFEKHYQRKDIEFKGI